MKRLIEIRAGEGGQDAALFVGDLANAYLKLAGKLGWKGYVSDRKPSEKGFHLIVLTIEGENLNKLQNEAGSIKLQRVPPTERNGRVHTSMITVAVINPEKDQFSSNDKDVRVEWFSGTGKGGSNRNKTQNCCRLIHIPTGIIKTAQFRDRESSYKHAYDSLISELQVAFITRQNTARNQTRVDQIQVSNGDIRTFRFRDDRVVDHRTGKTVRCKDVMKGHFDLLWS